MAGTPSHVIVPSRFDFKAGDVVDGKYRIEKHLGDGSFGAVYKVQDVLEGKSWAMKLLRLWDVPSDIRQPLVDRFEMEFKTGRIPSRHLVHSVDYGYANGNPYIVMEFCSGGDLTKVVGGGELRRTSRVMPTRFSQVLMIFTRTARFTEISNPRMS